MRLHGSTASFGFLLEAQAQKAWPRGGVLSPGSSAANNRHHGGSTLHQLRQTRIRELKDQACSLPVLQKITGHRSLRTLTEHYPGPSPEAVQGWYAGSNPTARRQSR